MANLETTNGAEKTTLEELYLHSQSLLRLSRVLERAQSYDEVLDTAQQEIRATIGFLSVWVFLLSDDGTYADLLASGGTVSDAGTLAEHAPRLTISGDPFLEEVAAATEIVVVVDARTDPRTNKELVAQLGNRTIVNVPIMFHDRHLGVIGTGTFGDEGVRPPTGAERSYLTAMASHLAVTLDRIHLLSERSRAEEELRRYKDNLEATVQQRTAELMLARDAAEAANRAKSVFLANMNHELRTPLNAILGFSRLMGDDPHISEEQRDTLAIINRSGEHLLQLINDVLEMAKIESGRLQIEVAPLDLGNLLRDVVDSMQIRCREKGLELQIDQSSKFPRFIKGDEQRLRQVMLNLLGNAVKFTERGSVTIRLGVTNDLADRLLIEVQDTGPGIAPDDQKRIFEPFVQLDDEVAHQGTGLGLSITSQFVTMMGGEMSIESEPGAGSLFRVDLPLEPVEGSDVASLQDEHPGRVIGLASNQETLRILIAEDQRDNRLLLSRLMTDLGLEVRTAENGEECIGQFMEWRPHLIWMDRRMPRLDGVEATRRIRTLDGGSEVKIVALTASALTTQRQELVDAGMDDFVSKPYRFGELYDCMAKHLGLRYRFADSALHQGATQLTPALLSAADPALLAELRVALESLDSQQIADSIRRIGATDADLGETLARLAEEFEYTTILNVLREVDTRDA